MGKASGAWHERDFRIFLAYDFTDLAFGAGIGFSNSLKSDFERDVQ